MWGGAMANGTISLPVRESENATWVINPSRADFHESYRIGNLATVTFNNVGWASNYPNDTLVATLPFHPLQEMGVRWLAFTGTGYCRFWIKPDGKLYLSGYTGGQLIYSTMTYICTDS